jgi:sigma-B regulation protein RsbU (phosphoserine phosphatase)
VKRQRRKGGAYEIVRPAKVADELNKTFPWDAETGQFFTIVYAVLNCRTRELRYVSAGHPGFVHVPGKGACNISTSADRPIGLQDEPYREHVIELAPGDRVYMYSDGVTECANPTNGLFGEERLCRALEEQRRLALENSLEDLLKQLEAWRRGAPPRDDISLLACQVPH